MSVYHGFRLKTTDYGFSIQKSIQNESGIPTKKASNWRLFISFYRLSSCERTVFKPSALMRYGLPFLELISRLLLSLLKTGIVQSARI